MARKKGYVEFKVYLEPEDRDEFRRTSKAYSKSMNGMLKMVMKMLGDKEFVIVRGAPIRVDKGLRHWPIEELVEMFETQIDYYLKKRKKK
jgi:hypothetical protein